jgi:hypothetical protein
LIFPERVRGQISTQTHDVGVFCGESISRMNSSPHISDELVRVPNTVALASRPQDASEKGTYLWMSGGSLRLRERFGTVHDLVGIQFVNLGLW